MGSPTVDKEPTGRNSRLEVNQSPQVSPSPAPSIEEKMELQGLILFTQLIQRDVLKGLYWALMYVSSVLAKDVALTESQQQHISSINMELLDILDTTYLPDDLKEDIRSLPSNGMAALLKDLESQLTDQVAYKFCTLLCEKVDEEPWIDVTLVFQILFLPRVRGRQWFAILP